MTWRSLNVLVWVLIGFHFRVADAQTTSTIALKTTNGTFLTAVNGGGLGGSATGVGAAALNTNRTQAQAWETFTIVPINPQQFAIKTNDGNYITAVNGGGIGGPNDWTSPVHTDATSAGLWETFIITMINATQATIQTCDGHYLTANGGGGYGGPNNVPIHTDAPAVGAWETFTAQGATCPSTYVAIEFYVGTGGDDARTDSVVAATIPGQASTLCLKYGWVPPCQFTQYSPPPAYWANNTYAGPETFALSPPIVVNPGQTNFPQLSMEFTSFSNGPWLSQAQFPDNWNMASIQVTLIDTSGKRVTVLNLSDPNDNCLVRFNTANSATGLFYRYFNLSSQPSPPNAFGTSYGSIFGATGC